ncbi:calponin-homology (CH) domain-containing protein [Haematococcus lacustris]|uniref:Calponin-homology (CH) domain-containing protein n=1 Tax=Haematococcus lacustris TaxID=44745 RepID=A0A699ZFL1_HAELA|nr:calponin-homology (CH) domain-containing protein [Haematococcus lacustris]
MRAKAVALHNIVRVQALWRGWKVRRNDGRAKAEARRKLTAAAAVAARNPNKTLGARVRDALEQLKSRKDPAQLSQALQSMETGSSYSLACCELIVESRGVAGLLRLMRGLNRSKPHVDLLLRMLAVMSHICRHAHLVPAVFASEDCIPTLSERLQFFRDQEDVFMAAMSVVVKLLGPPGHALAVAKMPSVVKTWEGIGQIVSRRIDMERKYIHRLEGQKGSDASAKEATRKLLAAAKQLEAMQAIISQVTHEARLHGVQACV